jgi:hypothetical protein
VGHFFPLDPDPATQINADLDPDPQPCTGNNFTILHPLYWKFFYGYATDTVQHNLQLGLFSNRIACVIGT